MNNPFERFDFEPDVKSGFRVAGRVDGVYRAPKGDFVTAAVEALDLGFEGIAGDQHAGFTRKSGGREPWYPRGTEMANDRQVSVLSAEELARVAAAIGLNAIDPEWIGGNIVVSGIPQFSMLPRGTRLVFEGGAVLRVDDQNGPCTIAGRSIARHIGTDDRDLPLAFVKAATRRRGVVAWVEKPGLLLPGGKIEAHVPEQWIYPKP